MKEYWQIAECGEYRDGFMVITGLRQISAERYGRNMPEVNLIIGIMIQAGKDRDVKYFRSNLFRIHCNMAQLDREDVAKLFCRIWEQEDDIISIEYLP